MSLADAQKIEDIVFSLLENTDNQSIKPIMERLVYVFNFLRSIPEARAKTMLTIFSLLKFEDKIENLPQLYIFFAEYRKESCRGEVCENVFGSKLYKSLNNFDDTFFKDLLIDRIKNSSDEMKASLAWHFWKLAQDGKANNDFERTFEIAYRYLPLFLDSYNHHVFERIFHFAEDHYSEKPSECLKMWKEALKIEAEYLNANESQINLHQQWWGRLQTHEMLLKVFKVKGENEFLECLAIILSYPAKLPRTYIVYAPKYKLRV
jgi:hypothetical protein